MVDGAPRQMRSHVAAVRKPLLSVSEMCSAGHDVHFLRDGTGYAVHKTGEITNFVCRNGVYEMDVVVEPWSGNDQGQARP